MAKNDFLDLTDVTIQSPPTVVQPLQMQQPIQPNPVEQYHQHQASEVMLAMQQAIASEAGKAQAQTWRSVRKGATNLPALLIKLSKVLGLCFWVAHGDLALEPLIHRPITQHIITSAQVGDGTAALFNPDKPFSEQHWALQQKTNFAVNSLMAGVFILLLILWEPANGDEAKFKFNLLMLLSILAAPVVLF